MQECLRFMIRLFDTHPEPERIDLQWAEALLSVVKKSRSLKLRFQMAAISDTTDFRGRGIVFWWSSTSEGISRWGWVWSLPNHKRLRPTHYTSFFWHFVGYIWPTVLAAVHLAMAIPATIRLFAQNLQEKRQRYHSHVFIVGSADWNRLNRISLGKTNCYETFINRKIRFIRIFLKV